MENASRAIILAGEILIGVFILSLAVYVMTMFGEFTKSEYDEMSETEITSFNVNFTNYSERADISLQDIVTLINLANSHNADYEAEKGNSLYVDVYIDSTSVLDYSMSDLLNNKNIGNGSYVYFYCNMTITNSNSLTISTTQDSTINIKRTVTSNDISYASNGMINKIVFHKMPNYTLKFSNGSTITYYNAIMQNYNLNYTS